MTDLVERLRVPCACGLGLREEAADEIDRLRKVRDTADLLVNECEGGRNPPSLGILAQLEDALIMAHKGRTK